MTPFAPPPLPSLMEVPSGDPATWDRQHMCAFRVIAVCSMAVNHNVEQATQLFELLRSRQYHKPLPKTDPPGPFD